MELMTYDASMVQQWIGNRAFPNMDNVSIYCVECLWFIYVPYRENTYPSVIQRSHAYIGRNWNWQSALLHVIYGFINNE